MQLTYCWLPCACPFDDEASEIQAAARSATASKHGPLPAAMEMVEKNGRGARNDRGRAPPDGFARRPRGPLGGYPVGPPCVGAYGYGLARRIFFCGGDLGRVLLPSPFPFNFAPTRTPPPEHTTADAQRIHGSTPLPHPTRPEGSVAMAG